MPTTVLETERLVLRPLTVETALALVPLADNPNVARWTAKLPHPYTDADARSWVESLGPGDCVWTLHPKPGEAPIGGIGLHFPAEPDTAYLGYWIGEPYWGRGYTSEAARAAVDFAFQTLGVARVRAGLDAENKASLRIFEKLGMTFLDSVDEELPARGRIGRTEYYILEADQWR